MRLISQLIKGISRVLQNLVKYFNGTIISTSFVPSATVLLGDFCLNANKGLLLLAAGELAIASLSSKRCSSL